MINADFKEEFKHIKYIQMDNSLVPAGTLLGYTFDPTTISILSVQIDEEENDRESRQIEMQEKLAEDQNKVLSDQKNQAILSCLW